MNEGITKDLCELKHKAIESKVDGHEKWLQEHEEKLDRLDRSDATNTEAIKSLVKSMGLLTKAIWGLVGVGGSALIGFFVYVIEKLIK